MQPPSILLLLLVLPILPCKDNLSLTAICFREPGVNLPIRYFFAQVQQNGRNISESVGKLTVEVTEGSECRSHEEIIDRFDGTYVIRLRVGRSCERIRLRVKLSTHSLCSLHIRNTDGSLIQPEHCSCPTTSLDHWIINSKCSYEPQLQHDLSRWESLNFSRILEEAKERWGSEQHRYSYSICHYAIRDNNIYRHCFGEYTGFASFADAVFLSLARKMRLPNTQFVFNLGDYPLSGLREGALPVVSWCGSANTADIVVPTYEMTNSIVRPGYIDIHTVRGNQGILWAEKKDQGIFRGRDSNEVRVKLARLSESQPDLLDAGITRYFFMNESENPKTKSSLPFSLFFQYRYVLSVDGTVAAYRFPFLLSGSSILLKSASEYYEHFYRQLKPFTHFIPFTIQNITESIAWARNANQDQMLQSMNEFVIDHLQPVDIFCYYATFLQKYTALLDEQSSRVPQEMQLISQHSITNGCDCKEQRHEL